MGKQQRKYEKEYKVEAVKLARACSHKGIDDESKIKKGQKDNIEFVITGENAAESLETAKKSFNLIALFV
jgi:hypothetical protein